MKSTKKITDRDKLEMVAIFQRMCKNVSAARYVEHMKRVEQGTALEEEITEPHYYIFRTWPERLLMGLMTPKLLSAHDGKDDTYEPNICFVSERVDMSRHIAMTKACFNEVDADGDDGNDEHVQHMLSGDTILYDMVENAFGDIFSDITTGKKKTEEEKEESPIKDRFRFVGIFIMGEREYDPEKPYLESEIMSSTILAAPSYKK